MSEPIHFSIAFSGTPERIYTALTDSALSGGAPASICGEAGAPFSCFGGMIEGREHLESGWTANYWDPLRKYLG